MHLDNIFLLIGFIPFFFNCKKTSDSVIHVPPLVMEQIYEEIKTPYKYGLVVVPPDKDKMVDSPSVFSHNWFSLCHVL